MAGAAWPQGQGGTEPGLQGHCIPFLFISVDLKEIGNLEVNRLNNLMTVRRMKKQITRIIKFMTVGIWHVKRQDVSPWLYFLYGVVKKLLLAIERATTEDD